MNEKKVTTPICDFVEEYRKSGISRFHMPGHKGKNLVGCESADITEISGADVLYSADGIIAESEQNATRIFGTAHTFYSTEGSSLSIKAMLALATCGRYGKKTVLAARNAHKAFVYGCALLDIDVQWLYPEKGEGLCSCPITSGQVRDALCALDEAPCAVYITSPDYLGNIADVSGIAKVCDEFGIPLLVDNAHGAYLKFLKDDIHPITLGAHMCCDSAHKTLPVLTGGGYLHISKKAPSAYVENARNMLSVFASTSPSYLILQSLDACNGYLAKDFAAELEECTKRVEKIKKLLTSKGFVLVGDEKTKLVVDLAASGFCAGELEKVLCDNKIEVEFSDGDYVVLMASSYNCECDFVRLENAFAHLCAKKAIDCEKPFPTRCEKALSIRQAVFAPREKVSADKARGRICGCPAVSCPPAIPIVTSGERIDENAVKLFKKYGIFEIDVVIE
ncbi:MAG: hypothetical protein IKV98_04595 [Clostridia bacterium]|nr:hypothetical protein [Clostridia bacterium]